METPLISKLCNALIVSATVDSYAVSKDVAMVTDLFKKMYGGLWVGGRLNIDRVNLSFAANSMNVAIHQDLEAITIPLNSITSVRWVFGFFTGIIAVTTKEKEFRFRCFGAKTVVAQLNALVAKSQ